MMFYNFEHGGKKTTLGNAALQELRSVYVSFFYKKKMATAFEDAELQFIDSKVEVLQLFKCCLEILES